MTKISGLIRTDPKASLAIGHRDRLSNGIHKVVANNLLKIILTNVSVAENILPKEMVNRYDTRSPVSHLTVTGDLATGIGASLNLMVKKTAAATMRQLKTKVIALSFSAPDKDHH